MNQRLLISTLNLILIATIFGFAKVPFTAAQTPDCSDSGQLTQLAMNFCASEEFGAADAELNAAWKNVFPEIKSRASGGDDNLQKDWPSRVLEAQRSWITFRDAHCESVSFAYRGGSIEPLIFQNCRTELTRQRTRQIKALIEE